MMESPVETKEQNIYPQEEKERHEIELKSGGSIFVEQTNPGMFKIVDNTFMLEKSKLLGAQIAYTNLDGEVEDLCSPGSDIKTFTGLSDKVRREDATFDGDIIYAPSLERIKQALDHVTMDYYDPADF